MDPVLLGVIGGLVLNAIGLVAQTYSTNQANKTNIRLAEEQNEWNRQQILDEREYNSPMNQIQRLTQSGLNSNLAYGNLSTQSAGSAQGSPVTVNPADYTGLSSAGSDVMNAALKNRELDIQKQIADSRSKEVDSVVKYQDALVVNLGKQNSKTDAETAVLQQQVNNLGKQIEVFDSECRLNNQRIQNLDAEKRSIELDNVLKEFNNEHLQEEFDARINNLNASTNNLKASANISNRELWELRQTFVLRKNGFQVDNDFKDSQKRLNNSSIDYNNVLKTVKKLESIGIVFDAQLKSVTISKSKLEAFIAAQSVKDKKAAHFDFSKGPDGSISSVSVEDLIKLVSLLYPEGK